MIMFYMDENVDGKIIRGLLRRNIDVLKVMDDGYDNTADSMVLERATQLNRLLITQDEDLLTIANRRNALDIPFSGIIYAHQSSPIGLCIEHLELIAKAGDIAEYYCKVEYIPFHYSEKLF